MSKLCPSGRLVTQPDGEARDELDYAPSIGVIRDGPLWVRGRMTVIAADGPIPTRCATTRHPVPMRQLP